MFLCVFQANGLRKYINDDCDDDEDDSEWSYTKSLKHGNFIMELKQ